MISRLFKKLKFPIALGLVIGAIGFVGWSVFSLRDSNIFKVRTVEIQVHNNPKLLKMPVREENIRVWVEEVFSIREEVTGLFDIPLNKIEKKLTEQPWIKTVFLKKKLPGTLRIDVELRTPVALLQSEKGQLLYLDDDQVAFGPVDLRVAYNYPVISGIAAADRPSLLFAMNVLKSAREKLSSNRAEISGVQMDAKGKTQILLTYPLPSAATARPLLTIGQYGGLLGLQQGQDFDVDRGFLRLSKVLDYLQNKVISATAIHLGDGKKIVVKTARGS